MKKRKIFRAKIFLKPKLKKFSYNLFDKFFNNIIYKLKFHDTDIVLRGKNDKKT